MATHVTYDELAAPRDLSRDCRMVGVRMRADRIARAGHPDPITTPVRESAARPEVDEATARFAGALYDA